MDTVWHSRLSRAGSRCLQGLQQICGLVCPPYDFPGCLVRALLKMPFFSRWSLGILIFEMLCGFTPFWDGGSPVKIYENILKGRVKYPPYIHHDAQDLLVQLITAD